MKTPLHFTPNVCKTTTRNALTAVADTLKLQADKIRESLSDCNLLKADETAYQMKTTDAESKQGCIWTAIADNGKGDDKEMGAATFSTLLTCMLTWKKRGLNISDMIQASLRGT